MLATARVDLGSVGSGLVASPGSERSTGPADFVELGPGHYSPRSIAHKPGGVSAGFATTMGLVPVADSVGVGLAKMQVGMVGQAGMIWVGMAPAVAVGQVVVAVVGIV